MLSWADFLFLSCFFALAIAASIWRRSARVSFLAVDNGVYLLVQICLPFQHGIEVVCLVGTHLWPEEADLNDIAYDPFQRLSVLLIHGEQEEWEHHHDHRHGRCAVADMRSEHEEKRDADERTASEADKLPFGQIEQHFGLDGIEVLGDADVCDGNTPPYRYFS